jgi:ribose transport system permease protein
MTATTTSAPEVRVGVARRLLSARALEGYAQRFGVLVALVLLMAYITARSSHFLTESNILNMLDQAAVEGLLAVGMTVLMITGSFDLSIGSTLTLTGALTLGLAPNLGIWLAMLIALAVGAVVGAVNGLIVVKAGINSLIVTLGSMSLLLGIVLIYSEGHTMVGGHTTSGLETFSNSREWLPNNAWLTLGVAAVMTFVLNRTTGGRYMQASGGNPDAAELAGINVDRYKLLAFVLMGVLAAAGGLLYVGRLGSIDPTAGQSYSLDVIAAVIIGGTSLFGGSGSIWRSLVGVFLFTVLLNGFNLLNIDPNYQNVVKGLVVILSVAIYTRRVRR